MKNRDYKKLSFELSKYSDEISVDNRRRIKKLNEYENMKISASTFMPMFIAMLASVSRQYGIQKYENLVYENENEKREIENLMKNISERLDIIKESEQMGLEISNKNFEKGIYDFVSSSENIMFEENKEMTEIIDKLESKYEDIEDEHKPKEENYET